METIKALVIFGRDVVLLYVLLTYSYYQEMTMRKAVLSQLANIILSSIVGLLLWNFYAGAYAFLFFYLAWAALATIIFFVRVCPPISEI